MITSTNCLRCPKRASAKSTNADCQALDFSQALIEALKLILKVGRTTQESVFFLVLIDLVNGKSYMDSHRQIIQTTSEFRHGCIVNRSRSRWGVPLVGVPQNIFSIIPWPLSLFEQYYFRVSITNPESRGLEKGYYPGECPLLAIIILILSW